jgi:hypothetical protein
VPARRKKWLQKSNGGAFVPRSASACISQKECNGRVAGDIASRGKTPARKHRRNRGERKGVAASNRGGKVAGRCNDRVESIHVETRTRSPFDGRRLGLHEPRVVHARAVDAVSAASRDRCRQIIAASANAGMRQGRQRFGLRPRFGKKTPEVQRRAEDSPQRSGRRETLDPRGGASPLNKEPRPRAKPTRRGCS